MGRQKLVRFSEGAYHVNAKTNNSEWFPIPLKDCWNIFGYYLQKMAIKYNIKIHAFTLMSNHFHLLCSTPDENLDKGMNYFMQMTSKGINLAAKRKNHLYGGKYYWTYVSDATAYAIVYKYVIRNPIRAKLCKNIKNYPWTSLSSKNVKFNIEKNELEELIPFDTLNEWINFCPEKFDEEIFKKVLKKKILEHDKVRSRDNRKIDFQMYLTHYGR